MSVILVLFTYESKPKAGSDEFDVTEFYKYVRPNSGTKVLTNNGEVYEAEEILVPTKIDAGRYSVELTRKGQDLYKIDGTSLYIETLYCYEFTYGDEAVLIVDSNVGFTKGKVIFSN